MKKITIMLIAIVFVNIANAQWSNNRVSHPDCTQILYAHGDVLVGNNSGGNLGMSFIFNSKYSFEIGYSATSNRVLPTNKMIGLSDYPTLLINRDSKYFSMGVGFIYGIISRN